MYHNQNFKCATLIAAALFAGHAAAVAAGFPAAATHAADRVGVAAVNVLADVGTSLLSKHRNEGGNKFHGNVSIDTKVRMGKSGAAEGYSEMLVGSTRAANSTVGGNATVKADAQIGGDVTARNLSTIQAASVDIHDSKIGGRLDASSLLRLGKGAAADNGSYINAASIRLSDTQVGGNLRYNSEVTVSGDLTARNLGGILVGASDL